jgi:hypothetical protein
MPAAHRSLRVSVVDLDRVEALRVGTLVTKRGLAIVASAGIGAKLAPRSPPLELARAGG